MRPTLRHPAPSDGRANDGSGERGEGIDEGAGGKFLVRAQDASQPLDGVAEDKRRRKAAPARLGVAQPSVISRGARNTPSAHAGKSRDEPGSSPHGGCRAEPNRASVDRIRRLLEHHQRTGSNQQLACQNEIGMSAEHEQSAEESRQ